MGLKILRWKGGSCGDLLLKLIIKSNPEFKSNVKFNEPDKFDECNDDGKCLARKNIIRDKPNVYFILDGESLASVDKEKLKKELIDLDKEKDFYFIKSHYYDMDFFHNNILDIIVDEYSLSYVIFANLKKTTTIKQHYNKLTKLIKSEEIAKKYALYNVGKDSLKKNDNKNFILVSDIIKGEWNHLKEKLKDKNIFINNNLKEIYDIWKRKNVSYFPSKEYLNYLLIKDYNYEDASLQLHERYALLILSNKKFKIL
jgi:hypothetical protein